MGGAVDAQRQAAGDSQTRPDRGGGELPGIADAGRAGIATADDGELGRLQQFPASAQIQQRRRIVNGSQQRRGAGRPQGDYAAADGEQGVKLAIDIPWRLRMSTVAASSGQVRERSGVGSGPGQGFGICFPEGLGGAKMLQPMPQLALVETGKAVQQQAQPGVRGIHTSSLTSCLFRFSPPAATVPWPPQSCQGFFTLSSTFSGRLALSTSP